jgi:hypothetical protein
MEEPNNVWVPPEPGELPAIRESIVAHLRPPYAHTTLMRVLSVGKGTSSPKTGDFARDTSILLDEERSRLPDAVLYYFRWSSPPGVSCTRGAARRRSRMSMTGCWAWSHATDREPEGGLDE